MVFLFCSLYFFSSIKLNFHEGVYVYTILASQKLVCLSNKYGVLLCVYWYQMSLIFSFMIEEIFADLDTYYF